MSRVDITVGTARVELSGAEHRNQDGRVVSADFEFDDLLHAVARAAGATLGTRDSAKVQRALSQLRIALSEHGYRTAPAERDDVLFVWMRDAAFAGERRYVLEVFGA